MTRRSASVEEKARDHFYSFLLSLDRAPLQGFLEFLFERRLPLGLEHDAHRFVATEVPTNMGSRADLVIKGKSVVVVVEVKVDAVDQVGQYSKYREFFGRDGSKVYVFGLINKKRRGTIRDNDAFLEALGVKRVFWGDVLKFLGARFDHERSYRELRLNLLRLHAGLGQDRKSTTVTRRTSRSVGLLSSDNALLCKFFVGLLSHLPEFSGEPWHYGNAPYSLIMGKRQWRETFEEQWDHRLHLGMNKPRAGEPYFAFSVVLWNRTWCKNLDWFAQNRNGVAEHFQRFNFDLVRNRGSGWHRNVDWVFPFDMRGIKYANAFHEKQFSLSKSEYENLSWTELEDRLVTEARKIAQVVDKLKVG